MEHSCASSNIPKQKVNICFTSPLTFQEGRHQCEVAFLIFFNSFSNTITCNVTVKVLDPIAHELPSVVIQMTTHIRSGHLNSKHTSLPAYQGGGHSISSSIVSLGRVCVEGNAFNHQEKPVSGPARAQGRQHTTHSVAHTGNRAGLTGGDT